MKRLLLSLILGLLRVQAQVGVLDLADPVFLSPSAAGGGGGSEPPTTSLLAHYEADSEVFTDAGTTPAADGEAVYQWNDQSGNGNHLTQTVSGDRPLYQTSEQNGLPGIEFVSTDYLAKASSLFTASPVSIYVVFESSSTTTDQTILCEAKSTTVNDQFWLTAMGTVTGDPVRWWVRSNIPAQSTPETTTGFVANTACLVSVVDASSTSKTIYMNGANSETDTTSVTPATDSHRFWVGYASDSSPAWPLTGFVYEILVYSTAHDSTTQAEVESYLTTKWGL